MQAVQSGNIRDLQRPIPHGGIDNTINEPQCEINALPCGDNDPLRPACGGIGTMTHCCKLLGGKVPWKIGQKLY